MNLIEVVNIFHYCIKRLFVPLLIIINVILSFGSSCCSMISYPFSTFKTFRITTAQAMLLPALIKMNTSTSLQQASFASPSSADPRKSIQKIAIVGGGAAGLVTARVLSSKGYQPIIFEKELKYENLGGVWSYEPKSKIKPMYKGLRTNLPRELMAFREKKWGGDGQTLSFVTHQEVQNYLLEYVEDFDLEKYIAFGCTVKQLTVCVDDHKFNDNVENDNSEYYDHWPKVEIEWEEDDTNHKETFDAVCICNGHYSSPSTPKINGIEHFKGRIMHSIEYDDPEQFTDQSVLCIGGRASGADLAREISFHAKKVYLSDSTCNMLDDGVPITLDNVSWVTKTISVGKDDGSIHFEKPCTEYPDDIDVIIFCTGYDYHFPFINKKSNLDLEVIPGERRVSPLFEQLWHAQFPNIAFVGLQHSVVPFPFFELQAEAIANQLSLYVGDIDDATKVKIPSSLSERMKAALIDKLGGGPKPEGGRVQDTHYLGSYQWDACLKYATYADILNDGVKKYITTNKVRVGI